MEQSTRSGWSKRRRVSRGGLSSSSPHRSPHRFWGSWFWRLGWSLSLLGGLALGCEPEEHPEPENPPCLKKLSPDPAQKDLKISRKGLTLEITFSKLLNEKTINEGTLYFIRGNADYSFVSDAQSPPLTDSRAERVVPVKLEHKKTSSGGKEVSVITVTPLEPLAGNSLYSLILTNELRDRGSRPLNDCPDNEGIWRGDLGYYKQGKSLVYTYTTEAPPPRVFRITEAMADPPANVSNGEYVELTNTSKKDELDLTGLFLDDGNGKPREMACKQGNCNRIPPGGYAVIVEPDYNLTDNPYQIPKNVAVLTTKGSSSTLVDGGLSPSEAVVVYAEDAKTILARVHPVDVSSDKSWPSGKSLEKCKVAGADDLSNWSISTAPLGGTPGKKNSCSP